MAPSKIPDPKYLGHCRLIPGKAVSDGTNWVVLVGQLTCNLEKPNLTTGTGPDVTPPTLVQEASSPKAGGFMARSSCQWKVMIPRELGNLRHLEDGTRVAASLAPQY